MKTNTKRVLISLFAALLLVSAAACNRTGPNQETGTGTESGTASYIVVGTDESGNDVTEPTPVENVTTPEKDPTELNPTFVDVSKKVVVFTAVATVRTATNLTAETAIGWPSEGRELECTGESENWYRIKYPVNGEEQICYIAKTVAADAAALEGFTAVNEEVIIITEAVNVRSYPSSASTQSIRGSLKKDAKVTRVGVSENWSRILYEVTSETETNTDGTPVKTVKEYYISNDCLKVPTAETTAAAAE